MGEQGGEVVNLIGNHELMNLQGDLRYVHRSEMEGSGDYGGQAERQAEWSIDGRIGRDLRTRYLSAVVRKGTLFVHGGLDPDILAAYGSDQTSLDALNEQVKELCDVERVGRHKLFGGKGPFWNRFFADAAEGQVCETVGRTLRMVGAERMVIGHTPQEEGVNVRCQTPSGPRLILADTIISRAYEKSFGFSRASAIEYDGDVVTAIYFPKEQEGTQRVLIATNSASEL